MWRMAAHGFMQGLRGIKLSMGSSHILLRVNAQNVVYTGNVKNREWQLLFLAVRDFLITRIEKVGDRVENVVKIVVPQVQRQPTERWRAADAGHCASACFQSGPPSDG